MKNQDEKIHAMAWTLMRIMAKHAMIEEMPVPIAEGVELTPKEIHAIHAVGQHQSVNITDLGACSGVTKSAASQMAGKLVRNGFLEKTRANQNNKEWRLSLTSLGRQAFDAHRLIHEKHLDDLARRLDSFSSKQIAAAADILGVIEQIVGERLAQLSEKRFFWMDSTETSQ